MNSLPEGETNAALYHSTIEGHPITEYHGIVFGEVIAGVNVVKDITASFSNFLAVAPIPMKTN